MTDLSTVEIKINDQVFSVEVGSDYKSLSKAWERANQDVMKTEVVGNNIPHDQKIAAAESVVKYDRQLKEVEGRLLTAWHTVAKKRNYIFRGWLCFRPSIY